MYQYTDKFVTLRTIYQESDLKHSLGIESQFIMLIDKYNKNKDNLLCSQQYTEELICLFEDYHETILKYCVEAGMTTNFLSIMQTVSQIVMDEYEEIKSMPYEEQVGFDQLKYRFGCARWDIVQLLKKLEKQQKLKTEIFLKLGTSGLLTPDIIRDLHLY